MNKVLTFIPIFLLFTFNSYAQNNIVIESGFSGNFSIMGTSSLGVIPGGGGKIDNRINFAGSKFVLKNSFGLTTYGRKPLDGEKEINKALDYHWMLDAMAEYNFLRFGQLHYHSIRHWTPYIGGGINTILRFTGDYANRKASRGIYFTIKGSLGIKYRINEFFVMNVEGYLEYDFSDMLDNKNRNIEEHPSVYPDFLRYDHTAHFLIGITYVIHKRVRYPRLPWSDNLFKKNKRPF
ncbi:MAG: DUF6089 family protein [Bacteroidota bacterium]